MHQEYSNWINLISNSYRVLLKSGRNYAAFNLRQIQPYIEEFKINGASEIFDPMSGYGTLAQPCNELGISTYCVEINTPSYLWQVLTNNGNKINYDKAISAMISSKCSWFEPSTISEVSEQWLTDNGYKILESLYISALSELGNQEQAIALILPFSGRVATITNGDACHVKKGGLAVYVGYKEDFILYLKRVLLSIKQKIIPHNSSQNICKLDNCITSDFDDHIFSFMITSPPYPNLIDYAKMFGVENYLLEQLYKKKILNISKNLDDPIGSNVVSGKSYGEIISPSANMFINDIIHYNKTKKATNDNRVYYGPYFSNYFYNMQKAYENIAKHLSNRFSGIIIVRNNTARNYIVPVAQSIIETWKSLGFNADIIDENQVYHVGTKNPHAKGMKAKHTEYVLRVWRNV